jgi:CrcB protein
LATGAAAVIWVGIAVLAALGAVARVLVGALFQRRDQSAPVPVSTLVVNATGSLAAGVVAGLALWHGLGGDSRRLLAVGFLGGYTTFSTFAADTVELALRSPRRAGLNVMLELAAPMAAAAVGVVAVSLLG